jgi:hypothetical protein
MLSPLTSIKWGVFFSPSWGIRNKPDEIYTGRENPKTGKTG